jgi:large subunit ribosomal protein L24e
MNKKECVFCGSKIEPGTGKMVVDPSGAVEFYCSSKCEKNIRLNRKSRKVKWTQEYRREKDIRVQHLKESKPKKAEKKKEKPKAEKDSKKSKSKK